MPVPVPRQRDTPAAESGQAVLSITTDRPATHPAAHQALNLLVIEDDPAGGLTVPEILDADGHRIRLRSARNLTEAARLLTPDVHCVLLDLSLPDAAFRNGGAASADAAVDQLATLRQVLRLAPRHAVLVLTAEDDAERAAEAVQIGAQDFLFRDELDGRLLSRAIRYAVERKRADIAQYKLAESKLR
ncbi:response regulator, partial [Streptomyces goshikiensis]